MGWGGGRKGSVIYGMEKGVLEGSKGYTKPTEGEPLYTNYYDFWATRKSVFVRDKPRKKLNFEPHPRNSSKSTSRTPLVT